MAAAKSNILLVGAYPIAYKNSAFSNPHSQGHMNRFGFSFFAAASAIAISSSHAQLDLTGTIVLTEQGGVIEAGNLSTIAGSVAFANGDLGDSLGIGFHQDFNLNDNTFGNGNSWIGDFAQPPAPNTGPSFGGISFAAPQNVQSFAFGRDNTGALTDRTLGLYTLQWTQVGGAGVGTIDTGDASTGWETIGTLNYGMTPTPGTNYQAPSLRHRYNFGEVIGATAMRLIVPASQLAAGTAIDELEFYSTAGAFQPPPTGVVITPGAPYTLTWDGNDGAFFDQNPPPGGAQAPSNLATTAGTAFGSTEFGGGGAHLIANVNDGTYGNSNSWIADFAGGDPNPNIGVDLGGLYNLTSFAFGRDNGNGAVDDSFAGTDACGGQCDDRSLGLYTIQITTDADPSTTNDWTTIGTIDYQFGVDDELGDFFTEYLRHEFEIGLVGGGPIQASGLRILVPNSGIAIDEIEISGTLVPEPSGTLLSLFGMAALFLRRRR